MTPYHIAQQIARQYAEPDAHRSLTPPRKQPQPLSDDAVKAAWLIYRDLDHHTSLRLLGIQFACSTCVLSRRMQKQYGYAYSMVASQRLIGCNLYAAV